MGAGDLLLDFVGHPYAMLVLTPLGIFAGAAVIRFAPMAGGSGVPQVLYAAALAQRGTADPTEQKLVSARTAIVKVVSTALGFLFGASIGIEGPMVQISTSVFAEMASLVKRLIPGVDLQSYIVAGAGTGIAAAFNAPLGGIAFALEEVASNFFGELRHLVLLAIIIAGLTTHALVGNELYFGRPELGSYEGRFIFWAMLIGVVGGLLGAAFGKVVTSNRLRKLGGGWWQRALIFGVLVAVLGFLFVGQTGGSNYLDTRDLLTGMPIDLPLLFPVGKLLATAFSTLSGLGGGILAPSLSIGAWMGVTTAKIAALSNIKACALLGMVAYFLGRISDSDHLRDRRDGDHGPAGNHFPHDDLRPGRLHGRATFYAGFPVPSADSAHFRRRALSSVKDLTIPRAFF